MLKLADLPANTLFDFEDDAASALAANEVGRRARLEASRRPSIAELLTYADDGETVDSDWIRASIAMGGRTAKDWRSILVTRGARLLGFAAAASTISESVLAHDLGGGLKLELRRSDTEENVWILILDSSGAPGDPPTRMSVMVLDGGGYSEILLAPAYRNIIQMDLSVQQAQAILAARMEPGRHCIQVW